MSLTLAAWFLASTALADPGTPAVDQDVLESPPACESAASIQQMQNDVNGLLLKVPSAVDRLATVATKNEDAYTRARLYTASMVAFSQAMRLQASVLRDADECHDGGYAEKARDAEQAATEAEKSLASTLDELAEKLDEEEARNVCSLIPEDILVSQPVKRCTELADKAKN